MNLKERAKKIKTDIPAIYIALKDKETPIIAKVLAGMVLVYALSPIDLIPDFIPVLGYLDDLIILPGLIALTVYMIPEDIMDKCRMQAIGNAKNSKVKKWYYAIPFLIIWIVILIFTIKAIF
ncbi:MAG: hypothetical protein K0R92_2609 [Lachnospiraceae bacterium]|jgi:uncharacterized membrane protein YkvA (DUF1232 family)|nr:hypothetical protein [Lachnospiraceae bacterium]